MPPYGIWLRAWVWDLGFRVGVGVGVEVEVEVEVEVGVGVGRICDSTLP